MTAGKARHLGLSEVTADELRAAIAVHPIAPAKRVVDLDAETSSATWCRPPPNSVWDSCRTPRWDGAFSTGTVRSAADLSSPTDFRRKLPRFGEGALDANLAVVNVARCQSWTSPANWWRRLAGPGCVIGARSRGERCGYPGYPRAARVDENVGSVLGALRSTPDQLAALDAAGATVAGDRFQDLGWLSAGRE